MGAAEGVVIAIGHLVGNHDDPRRQVAVDKQAGRTGRGDRDVVDRDVEVGELAPDGGRAEAGQQAGVVVRPFESSA
jgi:hypothetical protein